MNQKINGVLIAVLIMAFLNGCSELTTAKPAAESAVNSFHEMYNSVDFESIYADTHNDFRAATNFFGKSSVPIESTHCANNSIHAALAIFIFAARFGFAAINKVPREPLTIRHT